MPHVRVLGVANPMQFPDDMPQGSIKQFLSDRFSNLKSVAEPALAIGSGIIAEPVSGIAGIVSQATGGDGGQTVRDVQEALTFQPRTPEGQAGLQSVGESILGQFGEIIDGAGNKFGDAAFDATNSPALAAAAKSIPTAVLEALGVRTLGKAGSKAAKANIGTLRSGAGPISKEAISKLERARVVTLPKGKAGADEFKRIKGVDSSAKASKNADGAMSVSFVDEYKPAKVSKDNEFLFDFDPNELNVTEQTFKDISNFKGNPTKPISVTKRGSEYEILDGHHRAKIAKEAGKDVRAVVIPLDDVLRMDKKGIHQGDMLKEWIATGGPV